MTLWLGAVCPPVDGPAAHADHILLSYVDSLGLDADLVCTHVDRTSVVAAVTMSARVRKKPAQADPEAMGATVLASQRQDGRCVRFPGQEALTGIHPAAELVTRSAIDEVIGVGVPVAPDSPVDTRGFLRPIFSGGRLVLLVEPAAGGVLRPVEIADAHECCGGH